MREYQLKPRSAFTGLAPAPETAPSGSPGLRVTDRDGLRLATVMARAGRADAVRARLKARCGLDLPSGPRRAAAGAFSAIGTGPNAWLVTGETDRLDFATDLAQVVGDAGAVTDQSDGYAMLRLHGPAVAEVLAKGVAIDLHPRAFGASAAAVTIVSHIGVVLWRVEPGAGEQGLAVEIAVPRSSFGSFWSWLSGSAAAFGLDVTGSSAQPEP